jgi:hypothetical protein
MSHIACRTTFFMLRCDSITTEWMSDLRMCGTTSSIANVWKKDRYEDRNQPKRSILVKVHIFRFSLSKTLTPFDFVEIVSFLLHRQSDSV